MKANPSAANACPIGLQGEPKIFGLGPVSEKLNDGQWYSATTAILQKAE